MTGSYTGYTEIAVRISETAADALDTPIEDLPPLEESIDADAINTIVRKNENATITITFPYAGLAITVLADKTVYAYKPQHTSNQRKHH